MRAEKQSVERFLRFFVSISQLICASAGMGCCKHGIFIFLEMPHFQSNKKRDYMGHFIFGVISL